MNTSFDTYTISAFESFLTESGQKKFRAKQIFEWVYNKGVSSYDQMTNLPGSLRETLKDKAPLFIPSMTHKSVSQDKSRKYLLELKDGNLIETVGIPTYKNGSLQRLTVCFSTQVGCAMACKFCATGTEGFTRNLTPGEMVQQIMAVSKDFDAPVTNIVAMGQGEPFLNFENLVAALDIINNERLIGIGARHITVSTCGICKGIEMFGAVPKQYTLAVSLHSAIQSTRDELMPKCAPSPLSKLKDSLITYQEQSGRRITFEYLLIKDTNDSEDHLDALIAYCEDIKVHINLIPVNDIEGSPFKPVSKETLNHWLDRLDRAHIEASVRNSRGSDIGGACGQLKSGAAK